ncbi:hypothetical protein Anapl_00156 [Anas platyrhynchos]|uniref:Uncharacterized protein n=1 Tax=Anas platyrhynchos TaxID=8839 RepID=R0LEX0_ANAPL|nr:hypothetical protein Anapl_00156 [Anas platyrhynchos]
MAEKRTKTTSTAQRVYETTNHGKAQPPLVGNTSSWFSIGKDIAKPFWSKYEIAAAGKSSVETTWKIQMGIKPHRQTGTQHSVTNSTVLSKYSAAWGHKSSACVSTLKQDPDFLEYPTFTYRIRLTSELRTKHTDFVLTF